MTHTHQLRFQAHFDSQERLGIVRFNGIVTYEDLKSGARALFDLPGWDDAYDVIWDCSSVIRHVLGPEEVPPLVDELVLDQQGHDALIESGASHDGMIGDLLVRRLRRRGKSASSHANMDGALRTLGREALPESLR